MADGTVGVKQDSSPDRLIDNETVVVGGQTVYRQRVQTHPAPGTEQPVTGPLTNAQLRGEPVDVDLVSLNGAALDATVAETRNRLGATDEAAAATDTSTSGLNGLFKRLLQRITNLLDRLPGSLGQKTMANSLAVAVASDQSAIPVSGTVAVTGVATAAKQDTAQTALDAIKTAVELLDNIVSGTQAGVDLQEVGGTAVTLGQKEMTASIPVVLPSDQSLEILGDVNVSGMSGLVDSNNSVSGQVIANGATWNGTYTDVKDYGSVSVVFVQDSLALGQTVHLVWSNDGVTDHVSYQLLFSSNTDPKASLLVPNFGRYFRIAVTNGTGSSRTDSVYTMHHPAVSGVSYLAFRPPAGYAVDNILRSEVSLAAPIPAGTSTIGNVGINGPLPTGNNNIGDIDVASLPALPAGSNEVGRIGTKGFNGVVKDNSGDDVTVKVASAVLDASETIELVAAIGGGSPKKIRVLEYELSQMSANGATFTWFSAGAQLANTARHLFDSGFSQPFRHAVAPEGGFLFETAANANLAVNCNAASGDIDVRIVYIEVD